VIVDYAGFGTTTASAIDAILQGGTIVQVGLGRQRADISAHNIVLKELTYIGSSAGTHEDCAEVMRLIADGKAASALTKISFEEIGEGVQRLQRGEVIGWLVVVLE
jgi:propanol-preferring alcohol dehydrogenase